MVRVRLGRDAKRGRYIGLGWAEGFSTMIDNISSSFHIFKIMP